VKNDEPDGEELSGEEVGLDGNGNDEEADVGFSDLEVGDETGEEAEAVLVRVMERERLNLVVASSVTWRKGVATSTSMKVESMPMEATLASRTEG
ncbi:hypothetical protein U1Q18_014348, partial [Sarracenia purpurea var. burkii]